MVKKLTVILLDLDMGILCTLAIVFFCRSINYLFGSGIMTEKYGIVLNNNMDAYDFDFNTGANGLRPNPVNQIAHTYSMGCHP